MISYGRRVAMWAKQHPEKAALIIGERTVTWRELDESANRAARVLAAHGVGTGALVAVGLPKCAEHFFACLGAWRLGACVLSLRAALPAPERDAMLEAAQPAVVVSDWQGLAWPALDRAALLAGSDASPLPDAVPEPVLAIASGGSTGRPKVIVVNSRGEVPENLPQFAGLGMRYGQVHLQPGGLYHSAPFAFAWNGLMNGHTLIAMERFDPEAAADLMERHRAQWAFMAPIMMQRIAQVPGIEKRDLRSMEVLLHGGGVCPPWARRAWIDRIGGRRVVEFYGSTELRVNTLITGEEWLRRPGSCGRPIPGCEVRILDEAGNALPPGEVGEIFLRWQTIQGPTHRYLGAPPSRSTADGFVSVGDLGWLDADGYLYIADRRTDMIVSGAANVYPAEVEAALTEHPAVADAAVIGVPDPEWGRRVHAIVQPKDPAAPPDPAALTAHVRGRLAGYKAPRSYEFVASLPRDPATGKLRRSALLQGRSL